MVRRMRVSGKKQDNAKQINGLSCPTDFQRIKSNYISKWQKNYTETKMTTRLISTSPYCFAKYKREEVEIRHVPSCYDKSQIPSLTPTQLVFFDEVHVKQVCGPPATSHSNECNIVFPRNEEGEVDVERGFYNTKISRREQPLSTSKRGDSVLVRLR